jgi:hypothetical protein
VSRRNQAFDPRQADQDREALSSAGYVAATPVVKQQRASGSGEPTNSALASAGPWPDRGRDDWPAPAPDVAGVIDARDVVNLSRRLSTGETKIEDVDARLAADLINAGDLLPDWSDDWVLIERERLRHLRLQALDLLSAEFIQQHRHGLAILAGMAAARSEPLRDSSRFLIIQARIRQGNLNHALREYRAYKEQLAHDLGISPSQAIHDLVSGALNQPRSVLAP